MYCFNRQISNICRYNVILKLVSHTLVFWYRSHSGICVIIKNHHFKRATYVSVTCCMPQQISMSDTTRKLSSYWFEGSSVSNERGIESEFMPRDTIYAVRKDGFYAKKRIFATSFLRACLKQDLTAKNKIKRKRLSTGYTPIRLILNQIHITIV